MRPYSCLVLCISFSFLQLKTSSQTLTTQNSSNNSMSAIFVFGDSTVDPGNNNYIETIFKSNFPPYGREFPNYVPTGRFTDGRLVTDYIGSYLGIKDFVPPYLDPTLGIEELMTGVSFASAGSGLDPLTAHISNVIPMSKQLEYLKEYKNRLESHIGKKRTLSLINDAGFVISAGTNDFAITYFGSQIRLHSYTVAGYYQFLFQQLQYLIKGLANEGAQKIAVVGLPPIGCMPAVITLNSGGFSRGRGCIESLSSVARDYNRILENKLKAMQKYYGLKIIYADIYTPLINVIQDPNLGFDVVNKGCCGTGLLETSYLCNPKSITCPDASKYVFWDSIHPTDKTYFTIFKSLIPTIDRFLKL